MTVESVENVSKTEAITDVPKLTENNTQPETPISAPKVSPAQDLRNIQTLLVMGVFPGQAAPEICKAYQLLESMAKKIEEGAK
jgi:hypothetical protein